MLEAASFLRRGSFILAGFESCARQWAYGAAGVSSCATDNQRRKDFVNLDQELGGLPLPHGATESILRQLVKKGLIERPIQSLNGLGSGRITAYGIDVVQGTTRPPLSILLHQRITVQDVQVGEGNIQNFSDTKLDIPNVSDTTLDVPMDHSEASHDKPKSSFLNGSASGGNI
jgi:hypothetical protein